MRPTASMERTKRVFDQTAATYDPARARLIPGFDEFYGAALEKVPCDARRILDLGAGTGLFSAMVRAKAPYAALHLIDSAEAMLAQAQRRFAGDELVSFQLADYTTADWSGRYDAVVSALSIHHLDDPAKQQMFRRVHDALEPGGVFLHAEQILAPSAALEATAKRAWLRAVRALGATEEQIEESLLRQTADRCATTEDQLGWLRSARFQEVNCVFERGRFAVFVAKTTS